MRGTLLQTFTPVLSDRGGNVRQQHRFIAASRRGWLQIPRQQIRSVRFQQQAAGRNARHHGLQVAAPPLIADPARDPDRQSQFEICLEFSLTGSEAVRHSSGQYRAVLAQDTDKILVRIALMQEQRFAALNGQRQLRGEGPSLSLV